MRFRELFFLCIVCVLLGGASSALADVPQLINYQGVLLDSGSDPVVGPIDVVFTIYDSDIDGDSLWAEEHAVEPNASGSFTVVLGEMAPITDEIFSQSNRWLGVRVGQDTEIEPRTRLSSTPYAQRVSTVDGTTGGIISGDVSIQSNLDVDGDIRATGKATIGPGHTNTGDYAFVAGENNIGSGTYSTVSGGIHNYARALYSVIGGGGGPTDADSNSALGICAVIGGGFRNTGWDISVIGGGVNNFAGPNCTIGGGEGNKANDLYGTIGGGMNNQALNQYATVSGGQFNEARMEYATVAGGWMNIAEGGHDAIGGGAENTTAGSNNTISGGAGNDIAAGEATIGGGWGNTIASLGGTIGGGGGNKARGKYVVVGGGGGDTWADSNSAHGDYSVIAGGRKNHIGSTGGVIGGGTGNRVEAQHSCIPGGERDTVTGEYSMAFGYGVYTSHNNLVCLFDNDNSGILRINRDDRDHAGWLVPAPPIRVGVAGASNGNGAYLGVDGNWYNPSSRAFKEDFQSMEGEVVLEELLAMPIMSWKYKGCSERHIGPVAEDFVAAFGVGSKRADGSNEDQYLSQSDVAGVALVAVKELYQENRELKKLIESLAQRVAELEAR